MPVERYPLLPDLMLFLVLLYLVLLPVASGSNFLLTSMDSSSAKSVAQCRRDGNCTGSGRCGASGERGNAKPKLVFPALDAGIKIITNVREAQSGDLVFHIENIESRTTEGLVKHILYSFSAGNTVFASHKTMAAAADALPEKIAAEARNVRIEAGNNVPAGVVSESMNFCRQRKYVPYISLPERAK